MDGYFSMELGRIRQQEMVEKADHYRLVKQAKLAVSRNGARPATSEPLSVFQKVTALFRRVRPTSADSLTRIARTEPASVAESVIDLDRADQVAVQVEVRPAPAELPPLRRLQAAGDLKSAMTKQLEEQLLDLRETHGSTRPNP